jgi:hypothetical protein
MASIWGCASGKEFTSSYKKDEIQVDGNQLDWQDKLVADEGESIAVGFRNDEQNLYICLTTKNRVRMMQILRNGFTVWIKSPTNSKKTIGIKYPIAANNPDAGTQRQMQGGWMNENPDKLLKEALAKQTEILIVNKDLFPLTALPLINKEGLEIKLGFHNDELVYEMKIELKDFCKGEYCADVNAGEQIEITLQTEKNNDMNRGSKRGMGPGGGMGGQRGGGNRKPPEDRIENFKPLDPLNYDITLKLAADKISK